MQKHRMFQLSKLIQINDTQTQFSEAPTRNDLARKEDIPAVSKTRNYNHHNQTLTVK